MTAAKKEKNENEEKINSLAGGLIRRHTLRSLTVVNSDEDLNPYLLAVVKDISALYKKGPTDISPKDIKNCIDQIYHLIEKFNLADVTVSKILKYKNLVGKGGDLSSLFTFSKAVAGVASGQFGYLAWHVSKEISRPRLTRAAAVYVCGLLANSLYSGDPQEIRVEEGYLDPMFEAMDRESIELIGSQLGIIKIKETSDAEILTKISEKLSSEGKDQSLSRAWFPKNANSYLEVLIVVAKKMEIDVRGLNTVEEIETAITTQVFSEIWNKLPPEKKIEFAKQLRVDNSKVTPEYISSMVGLGAIGLANLGGFSTYMAASMSLSFLSSSIGIAIPFSGYLALSTTISSVIGPIGIAASVFPAAFEYMRAKPEKLVSVVVTIAACRAKMIAEGRLEIEKQAKQKRNKIIVYCLLGVTILSLLGASAYYLILK